MTTRVNYNYSVPTLNGKGSMGNSKNTDIQSVSAISDPFSPNAVGAKLPDSDSTYSVAVTVKSRLTLATDAGGKGGMGVNPSLGKAFAAPASMTTTTATFPANSGFSQITDYAPLDAAFDKYRIVSWGIRIYSNLPPTEQGGTITVITKSNFIDGDVISFKGSLFENISRHPVANSNVHWIGKPVGDAWRNYNSMANPTNYEAVMVIVDGAQVSSDAVTIELVQHLECQVNFGSVSALLATPSAKHSPMALAAGSNVHTERAHTHNGSTRSLGARLWALAKTALADLTRAYLPVIGDSVSRVITTAGKKQARRLQSKAVRRLGR